MATTKRTKSYAEKLKDPRWQRKRLEILDRDAFQCVRCSTTDETLHVHHKLYRKGAEPWDYEDKVFVTLCERCHESAEEKKNAILMTLGEDEEMEMTLLAFSRAISEGSPWAFVLAHLCDAINASAVLPGTQEQDVPAALREIEHSAQAAVRDIFTTLFEIEGAFRP